MLHKVCPRAPLALHAPARGQPAGVCWAARYSAAPLVPPACVALSAPFTASSLEAAPCPPGLGGFSGLAAAGAARVAATAGRGLQTHTDYGGSVRGDANKRSYPTLAHTVSADGADSSPLSTVLLGLSPAEQVVNIVQQTTQLDGNGVLSLLSWHPLPSLLSFLSHSLLAVSSLERSTRTATAGG